VPCQNSSASGLAEFDSRFRQLAESSIIGIFEGDGTGRILKANDAFLGMLGYSRTELEMNLVRWDRLKAPGYDRTHRRFSEELVTSGNAAPAEVEYYRKDGSRIPVLVGLTSAGLPLGSTAFGFMVDLTLRRQAEEAVRESEAKFRQLAENIHEVFWMMNAAATEMLYVSPAYEKIWGYKVESVYVDPEHWVKSIHPEDVPHALEIFSRQVQGEAVENVYRIVQPSGNIRWIRDRAFPVRDTQGAIIRLAGVAEDITERRLSELRLVHQSLHDDLTDLPNRRFFREKLEQAIANREDGKSGMVLFIDLDDFKLVNDTLGHAAGDQILKDVVGRFLSVCGESATLARFGGDEFTVLVTGIEGREPARLLAGSLIRCLDEAFRIADRGVFIGASIGISLFPEDGTETSVLKRAADLAMHNAKQAGKNRLQFFTPVLAQAAEERMELETRLRQAIAGSEFRLQFQPQFACSQPGPTRFEALVRWCPPGGQVVSPAKFIPAMEQNGLIVPIGTWVLQEACRRCAEWQDGELEGVGVAVNVSATQFASPDFVSIVRRTLRQTALPANLLTLELTETVFVRDVEASVCTLTELRSLGVTIALDDFGTGYSALNYLQKLPLDVLKIDQSFVAKSEGLPQGAAVLRCVVDLAHAHGLRVIGEGVETLEQLNLLESLGCDEMQGYLLGKPSFEVTGIDWSRDCRGPGENTTEGLHRLYRSEMPRVCLPAA
jgi:diguanylate cyclase (GGDEF)-like protein/PAS domain S-box-containing protein